MAETFLEYLTLPNPMITQTICQKGSRTESKAVYGPDLTSEWEDVTWQNLKTAFEDVLRKPMLRKPLIRDATDVPLKKREILEEDSVTSLGVAWQEHVLQHALEGTHAILREVEPGGPFGKGEIHFEKNTGRGHIKNQIGRIQRPDWCAYQKMPGSGPTFPNLVPGDSKPASKWKSEWINNENPILRSKADTVMWQVTRYMWDAKTRYSFILSEEELVPVRISVYFRDMDAVHERIETRLRAEQIVNSSGNFESSEEEDDNRGPGIRSERNPDASWGDVARKTGLMLEWCSIPWKASGGNTLTINLTLWWLLILAVQDTSIKKVGTYTPLSERTRGRGHSPAFNLQQTEDELKAENYGEPKTPSKRRAEDRQELEEETVRASKIQKNTLALDTSFSSYPRTRSAASRRSTSRNGGAVTATPYATSHRATPRLFRHRKQKISSPESESSSEDMSQVTDNITHSFSSHV